MGIRADGTKESELVRMAHDEEDEDEAEASDHLLDDDDRGSDEEGGEDVSLEDDGMDEELKEILEEEREAPMMNIMVLVTMFIVVLFINPST